MNEEVFAPPFDIDSVDEEEMPSLTYRIDFDKGRISGMVDGIEAVKQAIHKILITPRFKCLIYDEQYGCEVEQIMTSTDVSAEYIESAAEGFIKDALLADSRITDVDDFEIVQKEDDSILFKVRVSTIFGETEIEEVI